MKILIANDDGVFAPGIAALVKAFSSAGHEVTVAAPDTQRSAASHSLSLGKPLTVKEVFVEGAKKAYAIGGTPADCVKLALCCLAPEAQVVVSGVNKGYNAGTDVLYSGTVAAAMEGAICGRPAIAISIEHSREDNYDRAAQLAVRGFGMIMKHPLPKLTVLNLNFPAIDEAKGLVAVPMRPIRYLETYTRCETEDGALAYSLSGYPDPKQDDEDGDYGMLCKGYATATVLSYNMTDDNLTESIKAYL